MIADSLSDHTAAKRLTGMTNKIQQGASGVVIRFILNADETDVWNSRDWKAAGVRGGLKHEARRLFRDIGRAVMILSAPDANGGYDVLWSSDADSVCEQMLTKETR